jgi:hypothetical protein
MSAPPAAMMPPPTAATVPLAPGPVPPPVAGAPFGRPVLVAPEVPVAAPVGKGLDVPFGLAVPVGLPVPVANPVGKLVCEPLGLGEAEHVEEGVALGLGEADVLGLGDVLALGDALGLGDALVLEVQAGVGLQLGLGLGEVDVLAETLGLGDALGLGDMLVWGDALEVGVQPDVSAAATPPNGPVNATNATETSRVAVPVARPTSPTLCSFSQLICRDRRKIVTISWIVRLVHQGSQVPRSLHQCLVSQMAGYLDNHHDSW